MVRPGESFVAGVPELLVAVTVGGTGPDLELGAVLGRSVGDIEALGVSEELDGASGEGPLLG